MAGKPGRSGGRRPGAGAKPGTSGGGARPGAGRPPVSYRLRLGDKVAVHDATGDGQTMIEPGEVVEVTRTKLVIKTAEREIWIVR